MIRIDVSKANAQILDLAKQLSPQRVKGAEARAINRAISAGRTEESRQIRNTYNIKAGDLRKNLIIGKANRNNLSGKISAPGKDLPALLFRARQNRRGVSLSVKKGKRKLIRSAFIKQMPSGKKGVFARGKYKGKGSARKFHFRHKRARTVGPDLPISELRTVSIPAAGAQPSIRNAVHDRVIEVYGQRIEHEINRMIEQVRK